MGNNRRIPSCDPILSCAEAQRWEAEVLPGEDAVWAAMAAAGLGVAEQILLDYRMVGNWPEVPCLLVLAGKGHNGGDALLAAAELRRRSPAAKLAVVEVAGVDELRPLVLRARDELAAGGSVEFFRCDGDGAEQWLELLRMIGRERWTVCIDGLLGMQGKPPLREPLRSLIHLVNDWRDVDLKVAVDVPSGMFASQPDDCLRADLTVATGIAKDLLFRDDMRPAAGRLRHAQLGFFERGLPSGDHLSWVVGEEILAPLWQWRDSMAHKGRQGHLFILGGSRTYPGAVMMNVRAALQSGVGLVTAFVPESLVAAFAAAVPEAIWAGWPETPSGSLALEGLSIFRQRAAKATAVLAGSGLTADAETAALLATLLRESRCPWVLDADALTPALVAIADERGEAPTILTPHRREYVRLAGKEADFTDESVAWFCHRSNVITILKDSWTRVSGGREVVWVPSGNALLARGGSGDLLAGLVGGLVAESPASPLIAAIQGTYWHGLAADRLARSRGQRAVRCTDLLDFLAG